MKKISEIKDLKESDWKSEHNYFCKIYLQKMVLNEGEIFRRKLNSFDKACRRKIENLLDNGIFKRYLEALD